MNKTKENDGAFPFTALNSQILEHGLSKREYLAALAMQGILCAHPHQSADMVARMAIQSADALIQKLNETQE